MNIRIASFGHMHPIDTTWQEFLQECGRENIANDPINAGIHCERKFIQRTVLNWKGYVIRIDDYRTSLWRYMHHAAVILVRMEPAESQYYPDLLLALDSNRAKEFDQVLTDLSRGDAIGFNATVGSIGTDMHTRHFHVEQLWREEGHIEVPPHVHEGGRYADKPYFLRGSKGEDVPPPKANVVIEEVKPSTKTESPPPAEDSSTP
eukprot:TRINITY_DN8454_c0_g1_i1.p1 TRINITY_DN8454_c0_g1~~TRINITY_DN8454_c0_g1_i1.p1  ORF type:complete len:205 (+),score=37.09 TRINITY_DN8454_c0_g1_i1:554-1168(+)